MVPSSHVFRVAGIALAALLLVPLVAGAVRPHAPFRQDERAAARDDLAAALGDLRCSLERSSEVAKSAATSVVQVEVKNGGSAWAEPLVFRITPKARDAEPVLIERVAAPIHGRSGRLVGPKKRETYPLLVPLSEKELRGARVSVDHASFWTPGSREAELEFDESIVGLGPIEVEREHSATFGRAVDVSRFRIDNRTTYALDVMLEMEFEGEVDGTTLIRLHLEPEASEWIALDHLTDTEHGAGTLGVDVRKLHVVDWSLVVDDGRDLARSELERTWNSWQRLDPELFPLRARFRANVSEIGLFGKNGQRFDIVDTLNGFATIEASGAVALTDLDGQALTSNAKSSVERALRDVARQLARPSFDALVESWRPRLISSGTPTRVEIEAAGDWFGLSTVALSFADGRISAVGPHGTTARFLDHWTTSRAIPDGPWRVDSRSRDSQSQGVERRSFHWQAFEDGAVVARYEYHDEGLLLDDPKDVVVSLTDWTAGSPPIPDSIAPTGPLADRVREAWDGFYRYPSLDARLTGTYRVTTPGTDGVWGGYEKVEGTFDLEAFHSGFWRHSKTTVSGKKISASDRALLINAVEDRFLMWSGRELCWRPLFATAFAGATLTEEESGWIGVAGIPTWSGIRVVDGRVTALRRGERTITTIAWLERDGVLLPERIEQLGGGGRVELEWDSPTSGWWFPSRAHFTAIFGADWGPETLKMEVESVD